MQNLCATQKGDQSICKTCSVRTARPITFHGQPAGRNIIIACTFFPVRVILLKDRLLFMARPSQAS